MLKKDDFSTKEWIGLGVSIICMTAGVTAFAFSQFASQDSLKDTKSELNQRLDRIEAKVDALLEQKR